MATQHTVTELEERARLAGARYNAPAAPVDEKMLLLVISERWVASCSGASGASGASGGSGGSGASVPYGSALWVALTSRGVSGCGKLSGLSIHNSIDSWVSKNSSGPSGD